MTKILIDCGNCGPDFHAIRQLAQSHFDVSVIQTHGLQDTLKMLREKDVALVTVNRKLDRDYSDGIEVIRAIKSDGDVGQVPVMLVSNYEEHQQSAVEVGAVPGFGKLSLQSPETVEKLASYLFTPASAANPTEG